MSELNFLLEFPKHCFIFIQPVVLLLKILNLLLPVLFDLCDFVCFLGYFRDLFLSLASNLSVIGLALYIELGSLVLG